MHISDLNDEQITGQRIMAGFEGTEFNPQLKYLIETLKVGGLILFACNVDNPDQIRRLCRSAQEHARACAQPPLLIAIDQEGGQVARLKEPFTQFCGNPQMTTQQDAVHFACVTARELCDVGINMNMAPVLDVVPQDIDGVMAGRAFGHDPKWVAEMGDVVIACMQQNNMMAVAKHFPGIGRTVLDSHVDLPTLEADLTLLEAADLVPFKAAIAQSVAGIMLSHIHYRKLDPQWPASLSKIIAKELLRDQLGYQGVILTDDLDMGAIAKHFGLPAAIRQIMEAEIDIALICHWSAKIETAFNEMLRLNRKDQRLRAKGEAAVERILKLKRKYLNLRNSRENIV